MKRVLFLVVFILQVFSSGIIFAQAGWLDSTFGTNGVAATPFQGGTGESVIIQPDNKIIVCGNSSNFNFALARYNPNGSLDSNFGNNGTIEEFVGGGEDGGRLAIQNDGKILVGGGGYDDSGKYSFITMRLDSNGSLDKSFNGIGYEFTSFNSQGYDDEGEDIAVQNDGKIIVVGEGQNDSALRKYFASVRFNSDGTLDNTFGTGGKVLTAIGNSEASAISVIIQPDGKIISSGASSSNSSKIAPVCFAMLRYNTDGTLDNTFGSGGKLTGYFGAGDTSDQDWGGPTLLLPDGKIFLVDNSYLSTDTVPYIRFARFNSNGTFDNTFGNNGKSSITFPYYTYYVIQSAVLQPDGKIILAGDCQSLLTFYHFLLMRCNVDGTIDSSFGTNGFVFTSPGSGNDIGNDAAMQPDGKILLTGYSDTYGMTLLRFLSGLNTGVLNFSVKNNPVLIYPNPIQTQATLQYTLTQNEAITLALYNMQGQLVQTFFTAQARAQGQHTEELLLAKTLTASNYLLSISNGKSSQGVKVTVVK